MITGAIKNKVDKIWTDIWAGGTVKQVFFKHKGLKDSDVDEVGITDDFGDYLLKAGRISRDAYEEKQAETIGLS